MTANIWFTSDTHFGHKNIIRYCNRPFSSVEEMDEVMIIRWNSIVKQKDIVYHLGDVTMGSYNDFWKIIPRLNGTIHIITGSHDHEWMKHLSESRTFYSEGKLVGSLYSLELQTGSKYPTLFVLCHYAMRVWEKSHFGSFHLYGHSHGTLPGLGRSMDVGVDGNNFYPYSLDEVVKKLSLIPIHNAPNRTEKTIYTEILQNNAK